MAIVHKMPVNPSKHIKLEDIHPGMRSYDVIGRLIEAVKDLQKQVDELQTTIDDMILTGAHEKKLK